MNKDKSFSIFLLALIVIGATAWMIQMYNRNPNIGNNFGGVVNFTNYSSTTNASVTVGRNHSVTSTVASADMTRKYLQVCNNGIGNVTICYAANCVYGSGQILATSTAATFCNQIDATNPYIGPVSAAVSATTSPSTTSTLGIIVGD